MTEEQQARAIAEWLDNPIGPPPQGIDADVLEAVALLRPELIPQHHVGAESVLAAVEESRVVPFTPESSRVPWRRRLGGVGVLLAAAISGVVFLPNAPWLQDQPERMPAVFMEDALEADLDIAPAAAPTAEPEAEGLPEGTDHVTVRSASAPPETAKQFEQQAQVGPAERPSQRKPSHPQEMQPFSENNDQENTTPQPFSPEPKAPMPPPSIDVKDLSAGGGVSTSKARSIASATASSIGGKVDQEMQPMPDAPVMSQRGGKRTRTARPTAKRRAKDAQVFAEPEPHLDPQPTAEYDGLSKALDPLLLLRQEVVSRLGPFPLLSEVATQERTLLHEARSRLDDANPSIALRLCQEALAIGSGATPERSWLALVRGDAYRMLGNDEQAESSYHEALSGKVR